MISLSIEKKGVQASETVQNLLGNKVILDAIEKGKANYNVLAELEKELEKVVRYHQEFRETIIASHKELDSLVTGSFIKNICLSRTEKIIRCARNILEMDPESLELAFMPNKKGESRITLLLEKINEDSIVISMRLSSLAGKENEYERGSVLGDANNDEPAFFPTAGQTKKRLSEEEQDALRAQLGLPSKRQTLAQYTLAG